MHCIKCKMRNQTRLSQDVSSRKGLARRPEGDARGLEPIARINSGESSRSHPPARGTGQAQPGAQLTERSRAHDPDRTP